MAETFSFLVLFVAIYLVSHMIVEFIDFVYKELKAAEEEFDKKDKDE